MDYHFRIYYITKYTQIIRKIKERLRTYVSVNGESTIRTDAEGAELIRETERRGFVKIREFKTS